MPYSVQVGYLLRIARVHFGSINRDKELTDADKKQLEEFYLDNFIAPRARKLLLQKPFTLRTIWEKSKSPFLTPNRIQEKTVSRSSFLLPSVINDVVDQVYRNFQL